MLAPRSSISIAQAPSAEVGSGSAIVPAPAAEGNGANTLSLVIPTSTQSTAMDPEDAAMFNLIKQFVDRQKKKIANLVCLRSSFFASLLSVLWFDQGEV
eukprot:SAG31_NODE_1297_length_8934_cov_26.567176_2_plen_99_part_00